MIGAAPTRAAAQDRHRDDRGPSREDAVRSRDQRGGDRAVPRDDRNANARARDEARAREQENARARDNASRAYRNNDRAYRYDNRTYDNRGWDARRRYAPPVRIAPRFQRIVPYRIYTPRPYRPGFSLGIFFGRPVPYRYAYPYYPYPAYGYPAVAPGVAYGGVSFGLNPGDADVYVDGEYVGNARDFGGAAQPLTLSAGLHRIELQAPGYEPLVFDVNVVPGMVTPYQGGMQPRY
jgi:hypothetical protein